MSGKEVCSRLAQAFAEYFPSLHLNVETRRLEFAPGRQARGANVAGPLWSAL